MEVSDNELIEKTSLSQTPPMYFSDHKPLKDHSFVPFEPPPPQNSLNSLSKLHVFHDVDQFQASGSSSNPVFGSFDPFQHGSSTNTEFYECKPFMTNGNGQGHVMDNFMSHDNNYNRNQDCVSFNYCETKPPGFNFVVPDEVSSRMSDNNNTKLQQLSDSTRNNAAWRARKRNNVIKGQWSCEEDRLLVRLVEEFGVRKWSHIAQMLPGRIGKQCRERWHNHLRPNIKKDIWSEEEDRVLIQAHMEIGNKWAEIAKRLPGRTENSIKNHWNATKRRQYSKRKCRTKFPRCTLLQDYIKSLNLDPSPAGHGRRRYKRNRMQTPEAKPSASAPILLQEMAKASAPFQLPEMAGSSDFCQDDQLVQNCDHDFSDFDFDGHDHGEMFEGQGADGCCSIDSLLDDILPGCATPNLIDEEKQPEFETRMDGEGNVGCPVQGIEPKKEEDLMDIMSARMLPGCAAPNVIEDEKQLEFETGMDGNDNVGHPTEVIEPKKEEDLMDIVSTRLNS